MVRVAILGANGQVGAEVALCLSEMADVEVIGLVRSEYGAALLRLAGVRCDVVDFAAVRSLERTLAGVDTVADFTYPSAQLAEIDGAIHRSVKSTIAAMHSGSRYVYASSIMAFGMPGGARCVRNALISRTSYARIKRTAESRVMRLAQIKGIAAYCFRLGQVHGMLQSATQETIEDLTYFEPVVDGVSTEYTNTVFASSVAHALINAQLNPPGVYTIVSQPQWTVSEFYDYFRHRYHVKPIIHYRPRAKPSIRATCASRVARTALGARGVVEAHLLSRSPRLFRWLKGRYRMSRGAESTRPDAAGLRARSHLLGRVPGPTVAGIRSMPAEVLAAEMKLEDRLNRARTAAYG